MEPIEKTLVEFAESGVDVYHDVKADFNSRPAPDVVHVTQYDNLMPVIRVSLYLDNQEYTVPDGASANVRIEKPDKTYIYNPCDGVDSTRKKLYFRLTGQMTAASGEARAILEIVKGGQSIGTSVFMLQIDENPVKEGAVESQDEYKTLTEYAGQAQDAAEQAKKDAEKSAESERVAKESSNLAKQYAAEASTHNPGKLYKSASGILAQIEGTAGAPLTECKIYGATGAKTGAQTPEEPATFAWVHPTELTVCGRNLVRNESAFRGLVYPHNKTINVDYNRYEAGNYYSALLDVSGSPITGTSAQVTTRTGDWKFGLDSGGLVRNLTEQLALDVFHGKSFMIFNANVRFEQTQGLIIAKSDKPVPYEPYNGQNISIAGNNTLRGINGVADYLNLLTDKIGVAIGETSFGASFTDEGKNKFRYKVGSEMKADTKALLCPYFDDVVADGTDVIITSTYFDDASSLNLFVGAKPGEVNLYFENAQVTEYPASTGISDPIFTLNGYTTVYADDGTVSISATLSLQNQIDKIWEAIHELQAFHPELTGANAAPADAEKPSAAILREVKKYANQLESKS